MTNVASNPDTQPTAPHLDATESLEIAPRLGHFLEEYAEIAAILPVLTGLFVTSRLQLRGAQALLVNLAIAAMVRQATIQLKKQAGVTSVSSAATSPSPSVPEDYTIVHSTPGRLRLRIGRLVSDPRYVQRLEKLLEAEERVLGIRINRAAASLVIHYDGAGVSELELGMSLLQILDRAAQEDSPEAYANGTPVG
ncbi:hypothetical protein H6G20_15450 [Desertifilum sp. FACHB-1129]|uniref:Metal ABC transporter ATPase n=1 Tax=Desertifilum tharense IPPAS B-1220 TaxID=1781255 RepID=A0A1E5QEU8_9CYAN|nr:MULTISPECIES: hypothetical protein [Desertifilum]MDA0212706.1 hypothetical protein [Cyanobacteria bacterium FC1]MBD2313063.1 hypothetical protein [Desertifilum sp. FACHB-1129]MBD2324131.1 hypothetical protein [Desertifilum sp. FACHB-866]MBD2334066.1 hypothetical protein [Desertifilum sp. FACHB-868]OEJ73148.1 hypothetical protein BH720_21625 [Desertifilum tharense IPPAS B-1220]